MPRVARGRILGISGSRTRIDAEEPLRRRFYFATLGRLSTVTTCSHGRCAARFVSAMSKAFTREDDDAGFELAPRPPSVKGPITAAGARLAAEKVRGLAARLEGAIDPAARAVLEVERARAAAFSSAPVAARPSCRERVAFGAEVRFRDGRGREHVALLASSDEIGLVPHSASIASPLARALWARDPVTLSSSRGRRGPAASSSSRFGFPNREGGSPRSFSEP